MKSFNCSDHEFFECAFRQNGVLLSLNCRILDYGFTDRPSPEEHDHPSPPFARLFAFTAGGAQLRIGPEKELRVLRAGRLYLLPPELSFRIRYAVSQLVYFHLHITAAAGKAVFTGVPDILTLDNPALFAQFHEGCRAGNHFGTIGALCGALRAWLAPHWAQLAEEAEQARYFARLFAHLEEIPPAQATVKLLAARFGLTPDALSRCFRRRLDVPLKRYLEDRVLVRAQELLLHSDLAMTEIAGQLGFSDVHYFQRFFKRRTGITPGTQRQRKRDTF